MPSENSSQKSHKPPKLGLVPPHFFLRVFSSGEEKVEVVAEETATLRENRRRKRYGKNANEWARHCSDFLKNIAEGALIGSASE